MIEDTSAVNFDKDMIGASNDLMKQIISIKLNETIQEKMR
jgi:hypothetical protein